MFEEISRIIKDLPEEDQKSFLEKAKLQAQSAAKPRSRGKERKRKRNPSKPLENGQPKTKISRPKLKYPKKTEKI